jgi:hypothetical protein
MYSGGCLGNLSVIIRKKSKNVGLSKIADMLFCEVIRDANRHAKSIEVMGKAVAKEKSISDVSKADISKPESILEKKNLKAYILASKSENANKVFGNTYFSVANMGYQRILIKKLASELNSRYSCVGDLICDIEKNNGFLNLFGTNFPMTDDGAYSFKELNRCDKIDESIANVVFGSYIRATYRANLRNGKLSSFITNCLYDCIAKKNNDCLTENVENVKKCRCANMCLKDALNLYCSR